MSLPLMDLHIHSCYTHGEGKIREIAQMGILKKLQCLAVTEHVRSNSSWFASFMADMDAVKHEGITKMFSGIESKVIDFHGGLDATESMIKEVEIVVASVHRIPSLHEMSGDLIVDKGIRDKAQVLKLYLRALGGIACNPDVDIIGHPFHLIKLLGLKKISREDKIEMAQLFSVSQKAVEVNSFYQVPDLEFLKICIKEGVKVSIGSDAHKLNDVGNVKWSMQLLEKAGGTASNIIDVERYFC